MLTRRDLLSALQPAAEARPAMPQFNPYTAGKKAYGSGRPAPNVGMTTNKTGYAMRDAKRRAISGRA